MLNYFRLLLLCVHLKNNDLKSLMIVSDRLFLFPPLPFEYSRVLHIFDTYTYRACIFVPAILQFLHTVVHSIVSAILRVLLISPRNQLHTSILTPYLPHCDSLFCTPTATVIPLLSCLNRLRDSLHPCANRCKISTLFNISRHIYRYPSVHGAVSSNRKSYGPVRF